MTTEIAPQVCPTLPSSESAYRAVNGERGALVLLLRDWLVRGALIGTGMYVAGERKHLVRNALAGSLAIETFVLGWIWLTQFAPTPSQRPSGNAVAYLKYPWQRQPFYISVPPQQLAA